MSTTGGGWRGVPWRALSVALALLPAALAASAFPAAGARFRYRSYAETAAYLLELNATYPEVLRVSVAQETYGLPYPTELMCVIDDATGEKQPCQHFVVHLTNHSTLAADPSRPEVFISGALHGNERVGPIATVELLALMAKFSTWHAHPDKLAAETDGTADGATTNTMRWVHELVNARSVVVTPMTNAWGFAHDKREELKVDPNRDYNYMRSGAECMQSMTSRVINEIWRDHVFQMAITFHGGTRAVSYEWGSPDHYLNGDSTRSEKSPDHTAQFQLANTFATFAGAFSDGQLYPTGTMNDIVYGVTGGMEDWAYAASWENDFYKKDDEKPFKACKPTTFGGYPEEKTVYGGVTHRAFNMLVETSNSKEPKESELGGFDDLYRTEVDFFHEDDGIQVGHVTRNVRLALMMIEMVQPLVRWVDSSVDAYNQSSALSAFPSSAMYVADYDQVTKMGCGISATSASSSSSPLTVACGSLNCSVDLSATTGDTVNLQLAWEVLGSLTVEKTNVQLATSPTFETSTILLETTVMGGITRRFFEFANDKKEEKNLNIETLGTSMFMACFEFDQLDAGQVYVRAMAIVDQDWGYQGVGDDGPSPDIPPQSHMVNARTNPDWDMEWNGHRVKTSLEWFSPVMTVSFVGNVPESTEISGLIDVAGSTEAEAGDESSDLDTSPAVGDDSSDSDEALVSNATSSATVTPATTTGASTLESVEPTTTPTMTLTPTSTTTPTMTPTMTPTPAPSLASTKTPSNEDWVDEEEDEEDDDDLDAELDADVEDEVGDSDSSEDEVDDDTMPTSTKASPAVAVAAAAAADGDGEQALDTIQKTEDDNDDATTDGPSLQEVGVAVLATGAIVIGAIMALLYRRLYHRRRQPYESLNAPRASGQRGRRGSADHDDNEKEEEEEEDP